jgi:FkbM family methyltransferase
MDRSCDLIFDIGLHKGHDSRFYLEKGFRVVGVEATPQLCAVAAANNKRHIQSGKFTIVERALHERSDDIVQFFVNPEKDDWGSLDRGAAEKGVGNATAVAVKTISFEDLVAAHGEPYFIKCDIEGGDALFVRSLLASTIRPKFVSIEATCADDIARLLACGYDRFQIVNQYMNPFVKAPNPAREGKFVDAAFTHETSGLFGLELPPERWTDFTSAIRNFIDWYDLRARNPDLAVGWLDVHCCKQDALIITTGV